MAYATIDDLELIAGGEDPVIELADYDGDQVADAAVVARAIANADAWINGFARRLYGARLPFGDAAAVAAEDQPPPAIRQLAAEEALYQLKTWRRVQTDLDTELWQKRRETLQSLESGAWNPIETDPYPIGEGGGAPVVVVRDGTSNRGSSGVDGDRARCGGTITRADLEGIW